MYCNVVLMSSPLAPKREWKGIQTSVRENTLAVNSSYSHKPRTSKGFVLV